MDQGQEDVTIVRYSWDVTWHSVTTVTRRDAPMSQNTNNSDGHIACQRRLYSLTPTQRLKRGNKAANKRREIYSLFCEFWRCQYLKENICTYFLLRKLVIWLHSRLQESDSFFEVMFTTILILRQQNLTKARIKRKISIISNILIVILCSTKEYLEGPKTAAYVNNKIKLSYRIINEGIFNPKLSSDWPVWDNLGSYWMRLLLFCLWGQVELDVNP